MIIKKEKEDLEKQVHNYKQNIIGLFFISLFMMFSNTFAQNGEELNSSRINYSRPAKYVISDIKISGVKYLDTDVLINISNLNIGDTIEIPGTRISKAIDKLWKQSLFSDVQILADKIEGDKIFLNIQLQERPRLSGFAIQGVKKSEADDLKDILPLRKGAQVTDNVIINTKSTVRNFFVDKGFYNTEVNIIQKADTTFRNSVKLFIKVKTNKKVKIKHIRFHGNTNNKTYREELLASGKKPFCLKMKNSPFNDKKLRRKLKETKQKKWYRIFKTSKYVESNFTEDKKNILRHYNKLGYRDARIVSDSISENPDKTLNIDIVIEEGHKYYFGDITWVGNSKYSSSYLSKYLGINKGDIYNQSLLKEKLEISDNSVSSLYLDDGYLFFHVTPVEIGIVNDSINIEMRLQEGKQARINQITLIGNTKTNDRVVMREIRTKPGDLFRRSDIIRTQRELAQLGFFNPEKMNVIPIPDQATSTVDLEYIVEEKPSDQIELSGGWGGNMIIGTLGLTLNNFSTRNIFNKKAWTPFPSGDGQRVSLRAQTNGLYYQSYSASFMEPWLGGTKPNSLSVSIYHNIYSSYLKKSHPQYYSMKMTGATVGLGRRLKFPDDFFTLYNDISYQLYDFINNPYVTGNLREFDTGVSHSISFKTILGRNSTDHPIYPRRGSDFSLSLQLTPPWSLMNNKDYSSMELADKYKWIEFHKWKFTGAWFTNIVDKLVVAVKTEFGMVGMYNEDYGFSPFESYTMGGDGLSGYNMYGRESITLRGYAYNAIVPAKGGHVYDKFYVEMRYPISLDPSATLYGLVFVEGGNAWSEWSEVSPFDVYRSAGLGIRVFLPMFGKLGVDWGYGFDPTQKLGANKGQFSFIIGQSF